MSSRRSLVLRLIVVIIVAAVGLLVVVQNGGSTQAACSNAQCPHCDKTECVSECWADGVQPTTNCTMAKHTVVAPNYCPPASGGAGCRTVACP